MAQNDIGIDLGTTTIIIAQEGKGVVLNQPSVVAMDTRKNSVLEAGDKALAMVGRTPNYISAIFPLKDGVISDHTMTRELICRFVKQVYSSHMVKPRVAVCVPAAITGIESDAVVEAVVAAGARQVYLIDEPIAAALGSGIDITVPDGRMIIDIGGGTTDIAVLSLGGKVKATSVRVAGNHYDEEILKHVRNKYSIAIGQRTAEELKKHVACCPQKTDFHETMEIKGRSLLTGLPVRVNVSTADLYEPVMRLSEQIGTAAHQVLVEPGESFFMLDGLEVNPFSIPHDANEPVGYRIYLPGGSSIAVATDLGHFSETVRDAVLGANVVLLESNHDPDLLKQNPHYPSALKSRILGRKGHLSNASGASAAVELLNAGARHLLLGHLSSENNTPEMAFQTSKVALENEGARVGSDVTLHVASRYQPSVVYTIR